MNKLKHIQKLWINGSSINVFEKVGKSPQNNQLLFAVSKTWKGKDGLSKNSNFFTAKEMLSLKAQIKTLFTQGLLNA